MSLSNLKMFAATVLTLMVVTRHVMAAGSPDINTYVDGDGRERYNASLPCSVTSLYLSPYNKLRSTYTPRNGQDCCFLVATRNKCCVPTGTEECRCDPNIQCEASTTTAVPSTATSTTPSTTTTTPTTVTTTSTTTTTTPTTTTTTPTTTTTTPTTTTIPTTTTTTPKTTTTTPKTTTTTPKTTTTTRTTTTTPTTTTTTPTTTTTTPTTTTTTPTSTTTTPTTTTTTPTTTTTTTPTTTTTTPTTTTTTPTTTRSSTTPSTTTTRATTTTTKPTTTTTKTTTKPTTTTTKPTTTTTKPTTTTTKPTTTTTTPSTTTTTTTTTPTTTAPAKLCKPSPTYRILNGESAANDCFTSGALNITFLDGELSACNAAYTKATVNGQVKATILTAKMCLDIIRSASEETFQMYFGNNRLDIVPPDFILVDGPDGAGFIEAKQGSIFEDIEACQNSAAICAYNESTMKGLVDFSKCYIYSWGASESETYSQNGLKKAAVALDPAGCTNIPDDPEVKNTLCFKTLSGNNLVCSGDTGSPVYCATRYTGETVLVGVGMFQSDCDFTSQIKVIRHPG